MSQIDGFEKISRSGNLAIVERAYLDIMVRFNHAVYYKQIVFSMQVFVNCDFCGSDKTKKLWDNVVACVHCGLVYLSPRPRDLSSYYDAHYSAYHPISG